MNDYAKIGQIYGIAVPTGDQGIKDYAVSMTHVPTGIANNSFLGGFNLSYEYSVSSSYIGYSPAEVDAEINFPGSPDALLGRFDPQKTKLALDNQTDWPQWAKQGFTTANYKGVTVYSWGEGVGGMPPSNLKDRLSPPDLNNVGEAWPLAVTKNAVFFSKNVDQVEAMIDASQGQISSLASIPQFASAAKGLSELGAYSAYLGSDLVLGSTNAAMAEDTGHAPPLKKYIAYGVGVGKDKEGVYMALVLVHDSAEAASANVAILRERIDGTSWSSQYSTGTWKQFVSDAQIHTEGSVLLAKLYGPNPKFWLSVVNGLPLLLHE